MNKNNYKKKNYITFKCSIINKEMNLKKEGLDVHSFIKFNNEGNPTNIMCPSYIEEFEVDGIKNYCEILKSPCSFSKWKRIL